MSEEELQTTVDTEIDPAKLIVQEGEAIGKIDAVEHSMGDVLELDNSGKEIPTGEQAETVEGLPLIGSDAENAKRDAISDMKFTDRSGTADGEAFHNLVYTQEGNFTGLTDEQAKDVMADVAGEKAMITEVGDRAEAMVAGASPELVKQIREAAEASFQAGLDITRNEKQKIADDKARELLAKIQSGSKIEDVLPSATLGVTTPETSQDTSLSPGWPQPTSEQTPPLSPDNLN